MIELTDGSPAPLRKELAMFTPNKTQKPSLIICSILVLLASGCHAQGATPVASTSLPAITEHALLDEKTGQITIPSSAYSNTPEEEQHIHAAKGLLWARCILDSDQLPESTIDIARKYLAELPPLDTRYATFGEWSTVIAAKGRTLEGPNFIDSRLTPNKDDKNTISKAVFCMNQDNDVTTLTPVSLASHDPSLQIFGEAYTYADKATRNDPRFQSKIIDRDACISSQGFSVPTPGLGINRGSLTNEQRYRADIIEAECSTKTKFAQLSMDLYATAEAKYISEHQAEFKAMRDEAVKRSAKADEVLQKYGVI